MELISGFGLVLLFIVGSVAFILVTLGIGKFLRPSRPNKGKLTTYESGEAPVQSAWKKFDIRFYVVALIFLLFEAELVFLFPWATVFGDESLQKESGGLWAVFSFYEMIIFVGVLIVGLAYAWRKGLLEWIKPKPKKIAYASKIPLEVYKKINEKYGGE